MSPNPGERTLAGLFGEALGLLIAGSLVVAVAAPVIARRLWRRIRMTRTLRARD